MKMPLLGIKIGKSKNRYGKMFDNYLFLNDVLVKREDNEK
jgi:hypothetical protein